MSEGEPGVCEEQPGPVQQLSRALQLWERLVLPHQHRRSDRSPQDEAPEGEAGGRAALRLWDRPGSERLLHSLPLREDGLPGPGPAARPAQPVLVRRAGPAGHLQPEQRVCEQQAQEVGSHPDLRTEV